MDYAENGSLEERILRPPLLGEYTFDEQQVLQWAGEILDALACLHGGDDGKFQSFSHSDIHSGNLLLDREDRILLADFGLARKLNPLSGGRMSGQGSGGASMGGNASAYASRARYEGKMAKNDGGKDDMWGVGCVLAELVTGTMLRDRLAAGTAGGRSYGGGCGGGGGGGAALCCCEPGVRSALFRECEAACAGGTTSMLYRLVEDMLGEDPVLRKSAGQVIR
jgi:hypothetical protein